MKDNKYRILLVSIFRVTRAINLPKCVSIPQIFLKSILVVIFIFLPNVAGLGCYMGFFFRELEPIAIISVKKVTLG